MTTENSTHAHKHATFNLFDSSILPRAILIVWHVGNETKMGENWNKFTNRDKIQSGKDDQDSSGIPRYKCVHDMKEKGEK